MTVINIGLEEIFFVLFVLFIDFVVQAKSFITAIK
jgi:hypothetical protein